MVVWVLMFQVPLNDIGTTEITHTQFNPRYFFKKKQQQNNHIDFNCDFQVFQYLHVHFDQMISIRKKMLCRFYCVIYTYTYIDSIELFKLHSLVYVYHTHIQ